MSTYDSGGIDPEELIVCPYDPVHRVARKRMQYHLIKCRKNFSSKGFKTCPFKATHVVPEPEFRYHISVCPYRGIVEKELIEKQRPKESYYLKGNTDIPVSDWQLPEQTESWDDDNVKYVPAPTSDTLFTRNSEEGGRIQERREPERPRRRMHEVREPPQPRMPAAHGGAAVFQYSMMEADMASQPPKPVTLASIGRGRGRGWHSSLTVQQPAAVGQPRDIAPRPGLGRGHRRDEILLGPQEATVTTKKQPVMEADSPPPLETSGLLVMDTGAIAQPVILTLTEEEVDKRIRKLKKMLRQIEQLEQSLESGAELNPDQLAKLARKEDVLEQLERHQANAPE